MPIITPDVEYELPGENVPCAFQQATPAFPIASGSLLIPLQVDTNGSLFVRQVGQAQADGLPVPPLASDVNAYGYVWNGVSWDRVREGSDAGFFPPGGTGLLDGVTRGHIFNGVNWIRMFADNDSADSRVGVGAVLTTLAKTQVWNGANYDRLRTANIFKTIIASAVGNTIVWTPAAAKKFRLMGYSIKVTGNATQAVAGNFEITLNDSGTAIGCGDSEYVPAVALNALGGSNGNQRGLTNGYLSLLANNVLNVNLSAALVSGEVRINVWGTEE